METADPETVPRGRPDHERPEEISSTAKSHSTRRSNSTRRHSNRVHRPPPSPVGHPPSLRGTPVGSTRPGGNNRQSPSPSQRTREHSTPPTSEQVEQARSILCRAGITSSRYSGSTSGVGTTQEYVSFEPTPRTPRYTTRGHYHQVNGSMRLPRPHTRRRLTYSPSPPPSPPSYGSTPSLEDIPEGDEDMGEVRFGSPVYNPYTRPGTTRPGHRDRSTGSVSRTARTEPVTRPAQSVHDRLGNCLPAFHRLGGRDPTQSQPTTGATSS